MRRPERILTLLEGLVDTTWEVGIAFGTIGARMGAREIEITTYRADGYDPRSRKPDVSFGDTLKGDLGRRDFTINAMAIRLPDLSFVDIFGGLDDLHAGVLRTPGSPHDSLRATIPCACCAPRASPPSWASTSSREVVEAMTEQAETPVDRLGRAHPRRAREDGHVA